MKRLLILALVSAFLMIPSPVAAAVPTTTNAAQLVAWLETRANPDAAFWRLNRVQRDNVKEYLSAAKVRPGPTVNGADVDYAQRTATVTMSDGEQCQFGKKARLDYINQVGVTLWTYVLVADRCWDGDKFTYTAFRRYATNVFIFWGFSNIELQQAGGEGRSRWQVFTQADFQFCIIGVDGLGCFKHVYPWMQFDSPYPYACMPACGPDTFLLTGGGHV